MAAPGGFGGTTAVLGGPGGVVLCEPVAGAGFVGIDDAAARVGSETGGIVPYVGGGVARAARVAGGGGTPARVAGRAGVGDKDANVAGGGGTAVAKVTGAGGATEARVDGAGIAAAVLAGEGFAAAKVGGAALVATGVSSASDVTGLFDANEPGGGASGVTVLDTSARVVGASCLICGAGCTGLIFGFDTFGLLSFFAAGAGCVGALAGAATETGTGAGVGGAMVAVADSSVDATTGEAAGGEATFPFVSFFFRADVLAAFSAFMLFAGSFPPL